MLSNTEDLNGVVVPGVVSRIGIVKVFPGHVVRRHRDRCSPEDTRKLSTREVDAMGVLSTGRRSICLKLGELHLHKRSTRLDLGERQRDVMIMPSGRDVSEYDRI